MAEPTMPVAASSVPSSEPCGSRAQPAAPTELEVITIPVHLLDDVVRQHPVLAREIVRENDNRVRPARSALAAVGEHLAPGRNVFG